MTGASDPGYALTGIKTKQSYGIQLESTGGGASVLLTIPSWYKVKNFEAETIMRRVAGASAIINFRFIDANNRWYVRLSDANTIELRKVVASTNTLMGTVTGVVTTAFQVVGIRAVGASIELFVNGTRKLIITDTDNISNQGFQLQGFDATVAAKVDFQYLAINPL